MTTGPILNEDAFMLGVRVLVHTNLDVLETGCL
jgi:hypothetical protein